MTIREYVLCTVRRVRCPLVDHLAKIEEKKLKKNTASRRERVVSE